MLGLLATVMPFEATMEVLLKDDGNDNFGRKMIPMCKTILIVLLSIADNHLVEMGIILRIMFADCMFYDCSDMALRFNANFKFAPVKDGGRALLLAGLANCSIAELG